MNIRTKIINLTLIASLVLIGAAMPVAAQSDETQQSIPLPGSATAIRFPRGAVSYVVATDLAANQPKAYRLYAGAGQNLYITTGGSPMFQVYGPSDTALTGTLQTPGPVRLHLSTSGYYTIVLQGSTRAVMSVYIPALNSTFSRYAPLPSSIPQLRFASGEDSASFTLEMNPAVPVAYRLWAARGQQIIADIQGDATVAVLQSNGSALPAAVPSSGRWQFTLPESTNYYLVLLGTGTVRVRVTIPADENIPPVPPPPASATRVRFGAGNASTSFTATLVAGQPQAYVLRVLKGQTLYVSTTIEADVAMYGPDNQRLAVIRPANTYRWYTTTSQTGDYTVVFSGSGTTTLTFYVPPL